MTPTLTRLQAALRGPDGKPLPDMAATTVLAGDLAALLKLARKEN